MARGNPVKFVFVSSGSNMPNNPNADTIYFLEDEKKLYVGSSLIADHIDPVNVDEYLIDYKLKDAEVLGTGSFLSNATIDRNTGVITFTRGNVPQLSKGTDVLKNTITLSPGDTFAVLTDTQVQGHTITDEATPYKLPDQISSIKLVSGTESNSIRLQYTFTNAQSQYSSNYLLGSAAFEDADDLATKQYVDDSVNQFSGLVRYLGISSTPITDGGVQSPTISGSSVVPKYGDIVIYDGDVFIWTGTTWVEFGLNDAFALKSTELIAGDGLEGGGDISQSRIISHSVAKSSPHFVSIDQSFEYSGSESDIDSLVGNGKVKLLLINSVSVDDFGHVVDVDYHDAAPYIAQLAKYVANKIVDDAVNSSLLWSTQTGTTGV